MLSGMGHNHANSDDQSATSLSLLAGLKSGVQNHAAWDRFSVRYSPRIHRWCRQWGLQEADAADVTQNVMLQLSRQMESFEYDPNGRFRSWLKTITWRAWARYLDGRRRNPAEPVSTDVMETLNSVAAKDALMESLNDEANREVLEIALHRVRRRVREQNFEAFRKMTFEGLSGEETAKALQMNPGTVFVAKSRIDKMLSEEVARLDPESVT